MSKVRTLDRVFFLFRTRPDQTGPNRTGLDRIRPVLTPESLTWDPHTFINQDQENSMMNYIEEFKEKPNQDHSILAAKINWSVPSVISYTSALAEALESNTSHNNIQDLT